ncbi:hypothetical protein SAMN04488000_13347 [Lentzea albida]|uniref:Uncharacterized protein n=1 Tax=Lentzea albida TaxID=65499 RepID=A0A1H9XFP9_9PSEU|nr:hypothetical protein SAMN04488000_13347 [Lentzea albida]
MLFVRNPNNPAGTALQWAAGHTNVAVLRKVHVPFSVNALAQVAATTRSSCGRSSTKAPA